MTDVISKTVKEAFDILLNEYKAYSGTIEVMSWNNRNYPIIRLEFKEGNGYILTDNTVMDKQVISFMVYGVGYYKHIELYIKEERL